MNLSDAINVRRGEPAAAILTIFDNDALPEIEFGSNQYRIMEGDRPISPVGADVYRRAAII